MVVMVDAGMMVVMMVVVQVVRKRSRTSNSSRRGRLRHALAAKCVLQYE